MRLAELPLVAAPMAGGPTTAALARAVASAGGFPFLAGGYLSVGSLSAQVAEVRSSTSRFGVNLFVPSADRIDVATFRRYAEGLQPEADARGVQLSTVPQADDDGWADKLELLLHDPVPVVSFTFGLPEAAQVRALQRAGSEVLATITTPDEARAAAEAGVDGLVAQGSAAGGHSGTFDAARVITETPTADLARAATAETGLPVVAAGGVDGAEAVRDLMSAGATAVAVGTLLLRTDESGASDTYRQALATAGPGRSVITRAFTGRPARGLRNAFIDRHEAHAPLGYPEIHHLTRPLRQAAAAAGDADRLHLWAGTGYRSANAGPAAAVIRSLAALL